MVTGAPAPLSGSSLGVRAALSAAAFVKPVLAEGMAVPWGLLTFVIGILYGALARGKQDKSALFKQGIVIGLVLALVLVVIGVLTGAPALGFGGALGIVVTAVILSLLFILGVWIGDLVTGANRRQTV